MKQSLATITLVLGLLVTGWAQSGFVVAGNNNISVGQIFAIPAVTTDASSSPGVQQGYIFIHEYEDDRCEGYAYNGYGFSLPATTNPVDTLLVKYDPDERDYYGYDSITHLQLWVHLDPVLPVQEPAVLQRDVKIKLIPYGFMAYRISMFPYVGK